MNKPESPEKAQSWNEGFRAARDYAAELFAKGQADVPVNPYASPSSSEPAEPERFVPDVVEAEDALADLLITAENVRNVLLEHIPAGSDAQDYETDESIALAIGGVISDLRERLAVAEQRLAERVVWRELTEDDLEDSWDHVAPKHWNRWRNLNTEAQSLYRIFADACVRAAAQVPERVFARSFRLGSGTRARVAEERPEGGSSEDFDGPGVLRFVFIPDANPQRESLLKRKAELLAELGRIGEELGE